ncbi:MAG TPA: cytochrome c oxidase accessory protein CcoG, partial [Pseudomonas sp.]|nr:cytochrome c oxidase accessory protein CcoG [Pseudomonas sp.]
IALLLMIGGLVWGLQERSLINLDISRDRSVFRANSNGEIENIYTLKVLNKTQQSREYSLSLTDAERFNTQGLGNLQVPAGETSTVAVRVSRRDTAAAGSEPL